jgi:stage V sporulation protein R
MGQQWDIKDLRDWDSRIREKVEAFGLSCFPQEFEICNHDQMLSYMAYHGMPAHYPHWSFGKSYEKLKTLYNYGVSGLPYEMVINANPALAYLMHDNSLCLQILTIAHVYGHNDFFRNNFMYRDTRPEETIAYAKLRAERVRAYVEDPSIGLKKVERILDAAHALAMQTRRHTAIRKLAADEQKDHALDAARPPLDPFQHIHKPVEYNPPDLERLPLEPEEDILLFIAEHNPYLSEWQKDLLHMVHDETQYFLPQLETKIMNEGWASYWHHAILNSLDLPTELHLEFLIHHNQVIQPHSGGINPYHLGFKIWHDIRRRYDEPTEDEIRHFGSPEKSGIEKLFEVRETDRDVSFLRRFLTRELMQEMNMFEHVRDEDKRIVSRITDEGNWTDIRDTLLQNTGMAAVPVIRIIDADYLRNRTLYLEHEHDGRDLEQEYMQRTLKYLYQLWGRKVILATTLRGKAVRFSHGNDGFEEYSHI